MYWQRKLVPMLGQQMGRPNWIGASQHYERAKKKPENWSHSAVWHKFITCVWGDKYSKYFEFMTRGWMFRPVWTPQAGVTDCQCSVRYVCLCTVVIWRSAVGTDDASPAALRGGGPVRNGGLPEGRLPPGTASQLPRRTVSDVTLDVFAWSSTSVFLKLFLFISWRTPAYENNVNTPMFRVAGQRFSRYFGVYL